MVRSKVEGYSAEADGIASGEIIGRGKGFLELKTSKKLIIFYSGVRRPDPTLFKEEKARKKKRSCVCVFHCKPFL